MDILVPPLEPKTARFDPEVQIGYYSPLNLTANDGDLELKFQPALLQGGRTSENATYQFYSTAAVASIHHSNVSEPLRAVTAVVAFNHSMVRWPLQGGRSRAVCTNVEAVVGLLHVKGESERRARGRAAREGGR